MKKIIGCLVATLTVFSFSYYGNAYDVSGMNFSENSNVLEIEKQTSTETLLSNGVKKKEDVIYLKYNYDG